MLGDEVAWRGGSGGTTNNPEAVRVNGRRCVLFCALSEWELRRRDSYEECAGRRAAEGRVQMRRLTGLQKGVCADVQMAGDRTTVSTCWQRAWAAHTAKSSLRHQAQRH